jgi:hypothetical protein
MCQYIGESMQRDPTPQEIAKFKRATKALAELGNEGFHLYLANDSMNLMVGPSHDDAGHSQQNLIRAYAQIPNSGGGDW